MKKTFPTVFPVIMILLMCSCSSSATTAPGTDTSIDTATYTLPLPQIPTSITEPSDRAAFLAAHYWDAMDWSDSLLLSSDRFMGESVATYGALLSLSEPQKAQSAINALVSDIAADRHALETFADYAYTYFYYPGAPQYDAELYLKFINPILSRDNLSDVMRMRLTDRREQILKNRVGSAASDFEFVGTDGRSHHLLTSAPDAEIRVLMLYDPECNVCAEAIKILSAPGSFRDAQLQGRVAVIAVNAYGQDGDGPAKAKDGMPSDWIVGYSPEGAIEEDETYVIRATPVIYILDSQGRILEKDLSLDALTRLVTSAE